MLRMVEHRKSIFTTEFSRIMYCVPAHNAALHDDFFKKLQQFCPNIELNLGLPKPNVIKSDMFGIYKCSRQDTLGIPIWTPLVDHLDSVNASLQCRCPWSFPLKPPFVNAHNYSTINQ